MKNDEIHIKVSQTERRLFEVAAEKTGMTMTELIKKAVLAYVKGPLLRDEFAEALSRLETFEATPDQLAEHRIVAQKFESGVLRGLNKDEGLALLDKLQAESKLKEKKKGAR